MPTIFPTMATVFGMAPDTLVKCVCKRSVRADMMVDVRCVPVHQKPDKADFVCDGCKWLMHHEGHISYEELGHHHTVAPEFIEHLRRLDVHFSQFSPPKHKRMKNPTP